MERPRGTAAAVPPLWVPRRPRSARPRSTRTRRPSPHAAGASVSTTTRAFAPSKVRAMFCPRVSWLSRPPRRASTDSAASRTPHVTSDGTSTAPGLGRLTIGWCRRPPGAVGGARRGRKAAAGRLRAGLVAPGNGCPVAAWGLSGFWDPLARLGLPGVFCSRVLSQPCAPTTSGLRLRGLRS